MKEWPDFFIIGAMKAGSTALHHCLNKHPIIFMSQPKEPGFFSRDNRFAKGPSWYRKHFSGALAGQLWGDSSTCYSRMPVYPNSAYRIHQINPNAKFIYIVRDPVLRAFSHYRHQMDETVISGGLPITYKEFLKVDKEVLETGKYYYQIKPYYDLFGPENIHVCSFDELVNDTPKTIEEVCCFLNIDPSDLSKSSLPSKNKAGSALVYSYTNKYIERIRNTSLLKSFIDYMPQKAKTYGVLALKSSLMKSDLMKTKATKGHEALSKPFLEDIKFLAEYYKDDSIDFQELTGLDICHWKSFRS